MKTLNRKTILLIAFFAVSSVFAGGVFAEDIVIDENTTWAAGTYTYDNVYITNGATLTFDGQVTLNTQNLTIDSTSSISANGRGYGSESGPGAGSSSRFGGGGGYGGKGGRSNWSGSYGGSTYGSLTEPVDMGSGGGRGSGGLAGSAGGGAGGGAIRLRIAGTLIVDGSLTANGKKGGFSSNVYGSAGGGGGSGGSVYITANTLAGTGVISANGGDGGKHWRYPTWNPCGGGGGGRIAIYYDTNSYSGTTSAYGGSGHEAGGAGTILTKRSTETFADLLIDNGGLEGTMTSVVYPEPFDEITVVNGSRLELTINVVDLTIRKITVANQSKLDITGCENLTCPQVTATNQSELNLRTLQSLTTDQLSITEGTLVHVAKVVTVESLELGSDVQINHPAGEVVEMTVGGDLVIDDGASITASIDLYVPGDLTIGSDSSIDTNGKGYGSESGPGAGGNARYGGGAGYGGSGGTSRRGASRGSTYGSLTEPMDLGSGGGRGRSSYCSPGGGSGGGAIRLRVAGMLTVDGNLTVDGKKGGRCSNVYGASGGGGGSGGSIYITANTLAGTGVISTNGGDGGESWEQAGGGGGGRIAIYYDNDTFTGTMSANGGTGYEAGEDGTILTDRLMNAPDTDISASEESSSQSTLIETVLSQTASINDVTITGDLSGILNFTSFEMVSIESGSFAGEGFSKGQFEATIEGAPYTGDWEGVLFLRPDERRIYLKGSISGEIAATVEGYLTESVLESGIYDQYRATWRIGHLGTEIVSGTINLVGTVTYQESSEYPSTKLYVLQSYIEGITLGHSTGSLSTVINHVRIADGNNPYDGEGFSIISYVSETGSGQGWTYDKLVSPGIVELNGMFDSPLFGIASGILDESELPRTLFLTIRRVDLGLPPMADLEVKTWGPTRVSPGQTVDYIIEFRNDGVKAATMVEVCMKLPVVLTYVSSTDNGHYNPLSHEVIWKIENTPAQSAGYLSVKSKLVWGLPLGTTYSIIASVISGGIEVPSDLSLDVNYKVNSIVDDEEISVIGVISGDVDPLEFDANFKFGEVVDEPLESTYRIVVEQNLIMIGFEVSVPSSSEQSFETSANFTSEALNALSRSETHHDENRAQKIYQEFIDWMYYDAKWIEEHRYDFLTAVNKVKHPSIFEKLWWEISSFYIGKQTHPIVEKAVYELEVLAADFTRKVIGEFSEYYLISELRGSEEWGKWTRDPKTPGWAVSSVEGMFKWWYMEAFLKKEAEDVETFTSESQVARDPSVKYGPEGRVSPGQRLDYTVEYENEGEGIAFGVYFTDTLDEDLDDSTLLIGPVIDVNDGSIISGPGTYNPATQTITWFAGEVGPNEGGYADLSVDVKADANDGTEIINFATIYFPSVPEETRTNGIVSIVSLNQPPVADAGADQIAFVGPDCHAEVSLDGSDSNDPDGDELTYAWSWTIDGETYDTNSVNPTIDLPLGVHTIELVVNDGIEDSEPDYVEITVLDNTPPELSLSVEPNVLWPPNHKMVQISSNITVNDNCDESPDVTLVSIVTNEGDETDTFDPTYDYTVGDGHTTDDIQIIDGDIYLRAERSGTGTGRVYTITYQAADDSGNVAVQSATVTVPHNQP